MENKTRDFMVSDYGSEKVDKKVELNDSMSISPQASDEYSTTIKNLGGNR